MVALGQGAMDNYSADGAKNNDLAWILYFFVSAFIQIVLLNMLIAVMGNTFDEVTDNKQVAKL